MMAERINAFLILGMHDRLLQARKLLESADEAERPFLEAALKHESNSYVRHALQDALNGLAPKIYDYPKQKSVEPFSEVPLEDTKKRAMLEVAEKYNHEISPIIGRLKVFARAEMSNYEGSRVKKEIDKLDRFVEYVVHRIQSGKTPNYKPFTISSIVEGVIESFDCSVIRVSGQDKSEIKVDRTLLELALGNGLKNAIEALGEIVPEKDQIVINWGKAGDSYWISITDTGPGLPVTQPDPFKYGTSTKDRDFHSGSGLSLARDAMASMDGTVELRNGDQGATFKLSWKLRT